MTQTPRPKELWHFTALVDVIDDVGLFFFFGGGVGGCFRVSNGL